MAEESDHETPAGVDPYGFSHDAGALQSVAGHLTSAADTLHNATGPHTGSVDAGASTELVAAAMATMQGLGMLSTVVLSEAAARIDATDGSYGDIDNTSEGYFRHQEQLGDAIIEHYRD